MDTKSRTSLVEQVTKLPDPRRGPAIRHKFVDIVIIAICAVISGADDWVEVETYGRTKLEWLKSFLELPNGIPSHDTFGRVFAQLDTESFEQCFSAWVKTLREKLPGQVVAIDGKTLRRSHDRRNNRNALHMVSAWAEGNRLVLGQLEVDGKSNEITAIPELLRRLDVRDCIVTIDAMGCQREIAAQIKKQGGDYALALKDNQPRLAQRVETLFAHAATNRGRHMRQSRHTTTGKDHGRREQRVCRVLTTDDWSFFLDPEDRWEGLRSVIRIEATRQIGDVISTSVRYYISSLTWTAAQASKAIREHWGVENKLHWVLDVAFREDESRLRKGNGAYNFSVLRRLALNLLRQDRTLKIGIRAKRLKAGWDNAYLLQVLAA